MDRKIQETLNSVLADVLEKQAFMFAEPAEGEELETPDGVSFQAAMSFSGPYTGKIVLAAPIEMCREIAANVLGIEPDEEISESSARDSLKEVLNVLCGNLLTELAGSEPEFDISIPSTGEVDPGNWSELSADPACVHYMVDEYPTLVILEISAG